MINFILFSIDIYTRLCYYMQKGMKYMDTWLQWVFTNVVALFILILFAVIWYGSKFLWGYICRLKQSIKAKK